MKKLRLRTILLTPLLLTSIVSGCATQQWKHVAIYEKAFKQVLVDGKKQELNADVPLGFKDEFIKISLQPERFGTLVYLENLTPKNIKVIWSDSVIYADNKPLAITPSDVTAYATYNGQRISLIPPGAFFKQTAVPLKDINNFLSANAELYPPYIEKATKDKKAEFYEYVSRKKQSEIYDLMLTLEIEGVKKEYFFDFYMPNAKVVDL